MSIFNYADKDAIGKVYSVDTTSVIVQVENGDSLRGLQVNHLVVIRSAKAGQHLLGIINKIMRKAINVIEGNDESDACDEEQVFVENVLRITLIGTFIDKEGEKENVFRRTLETVPEIDALCFNLEAEKLTLFMKAIGRTGETDQSALLIGKYTLDADADAWLDGNRFFQRHAVIVGSTGCGKSWTVAKVIEQVKQLSNANALLFDIHGEYKSLDGDGVQHLKVAGPDDSDGDEVLFLPFWLLTYEEMISMMLDRSDQNAPNQAMLLSREVYNAKEQYLKNEDKPDILANFTVDSPIPYNVAYVIEKLKVLDVQMVAGSSGREKQGPFHGKLTRFIQRLESKLVDKRLNFLFSDKKLLSEYNWMTTCCSRLLCGTKQQDNGGVKVIDFSEVPSDILPLIVGLVARLVFYVQQWSAKENRHPISIFCDEAHLYIPERLSSSSIAEAGFRSFERIAKEGRKYGVSLVVISQRPSEVNRTVMSQCSNFVAMRLTNAEDQAVIKRLLPDSLGGFSELLPILDVGEAIVVGDASLLPSRIRIDKPKQEPLSATVDFWDRWLDDEASSDIENAVENLRKQSKS
ncbi:ATP-binding protein [Candidatus Pacearchaeota archaeon]|nr:ATP-binding protein [Candidatus Pacearchaeota archaeon]